MTSASFLVSLDAEELVNTSSYLLLLAYDIKYSSRSSSVSSLRYVFFNETFYSVEFNVLINIRLKLI